MGVGGGTRAWGAGEGEGGGELKHGVRRGAGCGPGRQGCGGAVRLRGAGINRQQAQAQAQHSKCADVCSFLQRMIRLVVVGKQRVSLVQGTAQSAPAASTHALLSVPPCPRPRKGPTLQLPTACPQLYVCAFVLLVLCRQTRLMPHCWTCCSRTSRQPGQQVRRSQQSSWRRSGRQP